MKKVIKRGEYMSERFELSFKNKEVRMWLYLMVPTFIIGSIIIFYSQQKYQYIPLSLLAIVWTVYYLWRYFYRKKMKNKVRNSS